VLRTRKPFPRLADDKVISELDSIGIPPAGLAVLNDEHNHMTNKWRSTETARTTMNPTTASLPGTGISQFFQATKRGYQSFCFWFCILANFQRCVTREDAINLLFLADGSIDSDVKPVKLILRLGCSEHAYDRSGYDADRKIKRHQIGQP